MKPMTVADLIAFLKEQRQDLPVCYKVYSEHCLLEEKDIKVQTLQRWRPDGWVHDYRSGHPYTEYLVLPGN